MNTDRTNGAEPLEPREDWRPTPRQMFTYRLLRDFLVIVSATYWRHRIDGKENVPDGPFILSPVHRSNIDTPLVAGVTKRRMCFMGKESMWKHRAPAWLFTAVGGFPVKRGTTDRVAMRQCLEVLARGEALVVYPEGGRRSGPVVAEMSEGAAYLSVRSGAPIVPVGIGGSERAMTKGSWAMRPVRTCAIIGKPIYPPRTEAGKRAPRRVVHELNERLRVELQRLFDEAQAKVGR